MGIDAGRLKSSGIISLPFFPLALDLALVLGLVLFVLLCLEVWSKAVVEAEREGRLYRCRQWMRTHALCMSIFSSFKHIQINQQ